ncbi:uncharacterized protein LACBIDRAFT_312491 [Laccaria bicolor S238N-H82]|uniref:Predicted protein n=1 Tax=Laccaria bicolor (strain S238N-H82 / ATCC MYA-4686) TaxID=486041 RepID=B0DWA5_LACBS|nr:uncharacterized protein LACBIDRAFT_312491 [Laccaria bicolor S238N-H82]EDR01154.1 predicted protein [Laccaria bicolor S238N-H82]|eukprot:XP_001888196.1 predicted protein [Laccaria bicolor S238N-H82]
MGCHGNMTKWAKVQVRELLGISQRCRRIKHVDVGSQCMVRGSELVLLHWVVTPGLAFSPEKLGQPFDIVSMQFCMHHTFETVQRRVVCLTGTSLVYRIRFENQDLKPMFGRNYWFLLQDAAENVPEYVARWENFGHKVPPIFEAMAQATAQGFMHCEPEPWAFLGLDDGPRRPGFGTAGSGWLTALGRAWHITTLI